jgi:Sec-independent protein translocase protein TatA
MITVVLLLLFLGYLVFGPKKTIEISQTVARAMAEVRRAVSQLQSPRVADQSVESGANEAVRRSE